MEFRPWLILNEANQHEAQALKMLGGDQSKLATLKSFAGEAKFLPVLALLHRQQPDLTQLRTDWEEYLALLKDKKMPALSTQGDRVFTPPANQTVDYLQWTEKLHALAGDRKLVQSRLEIDHSDHKPPIFKNDELEVYETDGPGDCIRYGKGYSFCISQPGNTMWQTYRDKDVSTFYFVYDRKRPDNDPLHIVVVDMTDKGPKLTDAKNTTGSIAEFGRDANAYLDHLHRRGVPRGLFVNKAHTFEEKEESSLLGGWNDDLDWFKKLSPDHKSKYIGRGYELGDEQFDYILGNGLDSLARQYAEIGRKLNDHQMERILGSKFRSNYLHFRLIANQRKEDLDVREYDRLNDNQKESLGDNIKFAMLLKKGRREEAMRLLGKVSSDAAVAAAADMGDTEMLDHFDERGDISHKYFRGPMLAAVKGKSLESIVWLAERGAPTKWAFKIAAEKGDLKMLKWLIEKQEEHDEKDQSDKDGSSDYLKEAAVAAAKEGHKGIVSYMEDNDLIDLSSRYLLRTLGVFMLSQAVRSRSPNDKDGQAAIIRYLVGRGLKPDDYFDISPHVVDLLLDIEATKKNDFSLNFSLNMLKSVAQRGNLGELEQLIGMIRKRQAIDPGHIHFILLGAARGGQIAALDFVQDNLLGGEKIREFDLDDIMAQAVFGENKKVMDWALSRGAKLKEDLINDAVLSNKTNAVKWLTEKMGARGLEWLKEAIARHGDNGIIDPNKKIDRSAIRKYADSLGKGEVP
jgi:hypothetical protein